MKLSYVRLVKGMQMGEGRLPESLNSPTFAMTLLSNIRCIKVEQEISKNGERVVLSTYVPLEQVSNFNPDPEALTKK